MDTSEKSELLLWIRGVVNKKVPLSGDPLKQRAEALTMHFSIDKPPDGG